MGNNNEEFFRRAEAEEARRKVELAETKAALAESRANELQLQLQLAQMQNENALAVQQPIEYAAQPQYVQAPSPMQQMPLNYAPPHVQTIELTGKKWKGMLVFAKLTIFLAIISLVMAFVTAQPIAMLLGVAMLAVGIALLMYTRTMIWWNHG